MIDKRNVEPTPDSSAVREALREALTTRGRMTASDTLGSRGELYVIGDNDLSAGLFEFRNSAREAIDVMYQGSWTEGLPPRFAVLHRKAAEESSFELLEQMHIIPLLYGIANGRVEFDSLDDALAQLSS